MRYKCIAEWEAKWNKIVDGIIADGTTNTEDGKWRVLLDDLADMNDSDSTFNEEIICAMLSERKEISFIEQIDDEYFIDFRPEHCAFCQSTQIDEKINALKNSLAEQLKWPDAKVAEVICQIGELLEQRNELTGRSEDMQFLFSDDNECLWFVAGFVGDDSSTVDANGTPLKVGDTVSFYSGYQRMVILNSKFQPMLSQEMLLEKHAVKVADSAEMDIRTAQSAASTVTCESCCEVYHRQQEQEQQSAMRMQ